MSLGKWVGLLALVVSLYILWQIRQVLLLVFLAVVLATALNRIVQRLEKSRVNRGIAALLSVVILLTFLTGFFWIIVPSLIDQFQQLIQLVPRGLERFRDWFTWLQTRIPGQSREYIPTVNDLIRQLQPIVARLFGNFFALFSNFLAIILNLLLVLVLTIMLLANPSPYRKGFVQLFPSFYRRRIDAILSECNVALGGWLAGILFNMTVITVLSGVGLLILQVPLPLVNALLAGLLTFIPNVGPTLSVIPPIAIALLDAPWKAIAVLILYIAIQQIETNILTPLVMQRQVSLLPAVTLASQVVFAIFFGFLGLLLALPLLVVAQVWLREILIKDVLDNWQEHPKTKLRSDRPVIVQATDQSEHASFEDLSGSEESGS